MTKAFLKVDGPKCIFAKKKKHFMKKIYFLLSFMTVAVFASAQCDELFFSEYSEGSSNNKYMEIYNPGDQAVDLANYSVFQIGNGGSFTNLLELSGMLEPNDVYVFTTDQADTFILNRADTALAFPSVAHFNGDDCMMLLKGTDTIDQIGTRRYDPGSEWPVDTGSTKEYTLVRKTTIDGPDTAWATTSVNGWDVYPQNTWDYLGSHESDCYTPASVNEVAVSNVNLYPNPATNLVHLETTGEMIGIRIVGLNGQVVFAATQAVSKIDLSNIASGMYVVEVQMTSGIAVKKLSVR
jgi:hypothetical protein